MKQRVYPARVYRSPRSGRFSLMFPDVPGCVSGGVNFNDCMRNAAEALASRIASMAEDGDDIPEPSELLAIIEENGNLDPDDAAEVFGVYPIRIEATEIRIT